VPVTVAFVQKQRFCHVKNDEKAALKAAKTLKTQISEKVQKLDRFF
jgi:hypothetical protein